MKTRLKKMTHWGSIALLVFLFPRLALAEQPNTLVRVLEGISEHYQVFFSYDNAALSKSQTDFEINAEEPVDKAIDRLLSPLDFRYEQFSERYYVIYSKKKVLAQEEKADRVLENHAAKQVNNNLFSSILLEKETGLPISDAFVFIRNSSISTTSDLSGFFQLDLGAFTKEELVITHLNYETQSYWIDKTTYLPENIYLAPKNLELAGVEVKSKRTNSKKRKKWLKRFKNAFLGANAQAKHIEIENPEVVWFREEGRNLEAEAVDYLSIINHQLGYKMRFYLDTFHLDKKKNVVYSGKVFFEEVTTQLADKEKVERNRIRAFISSKKYFFKSLWAKNVDSESFVFGLGELSDRGKLLDYEEKTMEDLPIHRVGNYMIITTDNYLAFANKNIVTEWGANFYTGGKNRYATGLLKPLNGQIIFDQNGNIINANEVEEYGYWTQKRIANLLPIEYNYLASAADYVDYPSERMRQLDRVLTNQLQEKIYLHLNKPYYSLRDELFFKAYLSNAESHQPTELSKVVYVDLIDEEKNIVKSWMLHTEKSLTGHFEFNQKHLSGQYTIRAYTAYMRNFGAEYFFEKQFHIYDYSKPVGDTIPKMVLTKTVLEDIAPKAAIRVDFYPEGGDLITGIKSNIAFEVSDSIGNPLLIDGVIEDKIGRTYTKVKTTHRGIGKFNLTPQLGEIYVFKCSYKEVPYQFELPIALAEGYVVKVNNTANDKVFLDVYASEENSLADAFLVGHVRGRAFCMVQNLSTGTLTIPKATIPTGLAHFTVFDGNNNPVAERLLFNDFGVDSLALKVDAKTEDFETRKEVTIKISLPDSLKVAANLSASITDQSIVNYPEFDENIKTWMWLNADLESVVDNPTFYLTNIDKRKRFLLDLLIMTKKWRRFNWQESQEELAFSPEKGYMIGGFTTALDSEQRIATKVNLSALKADFYYEEMLTDENGNFTFENIPFKDSLAFIMQGRLLDATASEKLTGKDRAVDFTFEDRPLPEINLQPQKESNKDATFLQEYLAFESRASLIDSVFQPDWLIDLDAVEVRADYILDARLFGTYDLNKMDWIEPKTTGMRLIRLFNPRNAYEVDYATGTLFKWENVLGENVRIPVNLFINGQLVNGSRILSIEADIVDYFYINNSNPNAGSGAGISITTRKDGPRSLKAKLEDGILNITHPGYHQARTFYAPNYSKDLSIHDKPDYRTAIHWDPQLSFDAAGNALLQFYTADSPARYEVRIEGLSADGIPIFVQQDLFKF